MCVCVFWGRVIARRLLSLFERLSSSSLSQWARVVELYWLILAGMLQVELVRSIRSLPASPAWRRAPVWSVVRACARRGPPSALTTW